MPSQQCLLRLQRLDLLRRRQGFHAIRVAGSVGKSSTTWLLSKLFARFKLPWGRFGPPCLGPETDTIEVNGHGLSHDTFLDHKTTLTWLFEKKTDAMLARRAMLLSHLKHAGSTHELAHLPFGAIETELGALHHVHNHDTLSPDALLTAVAIREFMTNRAVTFGLFHTFTAFGAHDCTDILTDYLATALSRIDSPVDQDALAQSIPALVRTYGRVMRRDVPCVLDATNHPVVIEALFRHARCVGASLILNDNPNHDALRPHWPAVMSILESGKHASALRPFEKQNILTALATFGLAMSRNCHTHTFKDPPDYPQLCHELMALIAQQPPALHRQQWLDTNDQFSYSRILFDRASTPLAAVALGQFVNSTLRSSPQPSRVDSAMDDEKSVRTLPMTWIVAFSPHEGPNIVDFLRPLIHQSDNICYFSPSSGGRFEKSPISRLVDLKSVLDKLFGGQLTWSGQGLVVSCERSVKEAETWAVKVANGGPIVITGSAYAVQSFRGHVLRLPRFRLGMRSGNSRLQDKKRNTLLNNMADFNSAEGHEQKHTKPNPNDPLSLLSLKNGPPTIGQSIVDRFGRSVSGDYLDCGEKHPTSTRIWAAGTAAITAHRTLSVTSVSQRTGARCGYHTPAFRQTIPNRRTVSTFASKVRHESLPSAAPQTGLPRHVDRGILKLGNSITNIATLLRPKRGKRGRPSKHDRLVRQRERELNPTPRQAARAAALEAEERMGPGIRGRGTSLDHEVYMAMIRKRHPESTWAAALEKAPQAKQVAEGQGDTLLAPRVKLATVTSSVPQPVAAAKPPSFPQAVLATEISLSPQPSTVTTGEQWDSSHTARTSIIGREAVMGLIGRGNAKHRKDGAKARASSVSQASKVSSNPAGRLDPSVFKDMMTGVGVPQQASSRAGSLSRASTAPSNSAGRVSLADFTAMITGASVARQASTSRASSVFQASELSSKPARRVVPAVFKAIIAGASVTHQPSKVGARSGSLASMNAGNTDPKKSLSIMTGAGTRNQVPRAGRTDMLPGSRFSPQSTGRIDPTDFKMSMMAGLAQHSKSMATSVFRQPGSQSGTHVSASNRTGRIEPKDFLASKTNRAGARLAQFQKSGATSVFQRPGKPYGTQISAPNKTGRIEPKDFLASMGNLAGVSVPIQGSKIDKKPGPRQKLSRPIIPTRKFTSLPAQPDARDLLRRMFPGSSPARNVASVPSNLDRIGPGGDPLTNPESIHWNKAVSTLQKTGRAESQDFLAMITGAKHIGQISKLVSSLPPKSMKSGNVERPTPMAGRVLQDIKAMFTDARAPKQRSKAGKPAASRSTFHKSDLANANSLKG